MKLLILSIIASLAFFGTSAQTAPVYSDSVFFSNNGILTPSSDIISFQFKDTTAMSFIIKDTTKGKVFEIQLLNEVMERYVNLSAVGGEDSMLLSGFDAKIKGFGPTQVIVMFYARSPRIHSISFGTTEHFIVFKLKYPKPNIPKKLVH